MSSFQHIVYVKILEIAYILFSPHTKSLKSSGYVSLTAHLMNVD